jgi:hypothetical protein
MVGPGAADMFAVSLSSLRYNALNYWNSQPKLVLDFGLGTTLIQWLETLADEQVYVCRVPASGIDCVSGGFDNGIAVMSRRTEITSLAPALAGNLNLDIDAFIVCDADTVFLRDPTGFPIRDGAISAIEEWNVVDGREYAMRLCRPSSFNKRQISDGVLSYVASQLAISADALQSVQTYNSGVVGFRSGTDISRQWRAEYEMITQAVDLEGMPVFSSYAAEQNALALAVHKQTVRIHELPRRFNQFPPRHPSTWPLDTVIAHFITFWRNNREARYDLWRDVRQRVCNAGILPIECLNDQ